MQAPVRSPARSEQIDEAAISTGLTFLGTLFCESDLILFRPIETWEENGKKRSRVVYTSVLHARARPDVLRGDIRSLLKVSEADRANIFFGVCPRFGENGRFDLAWQIRTVRALWTDIDHVTVDEAQQRIGKAGLPAPSILVNSGNGVHPYWLLDAPYQIDDVSDPLPVQTEWPRTSGGHKKPRRYIVENGDQVYLDQQRHVSRLSS